ncbi:ATP-binding protein [uncultured Desulfuromusa sp.]|uniref:ATP-binding protein n=1 Tax=uncultured Desulfuromusa sp. TaxID=219183 RepID=UPI002AA6F7B6|nr:ATP-binding protein [uncultured Desulfuromusa sp.]
MKDRFVSSPLNSLTITICYFAAGAVWVLYGHKLFVFLSPPQEMTAQHSSNPFYWGFVVASSGLLYLLLRHWGSSQTETQGSLLKIKQALKSYSEFTKAMIKAEDETALMEDVCRICVEVGGHRMAWIAVAENDSEKSLKPVTHWGDEGCFFDNFHASWAESECGKGPIGTSIRTNEPVIFQDLMTNPRFESCRDAAEKCGYASCISIPLRNEKQIFAALVIFDAQPNIFDKERTLLLTELAEDLSYGIQNLRLKAERKQEIEKSLMLAAVTEQTSDGVITFDASGTIEYMNTSFINLCGTPADEGIGVSIHEFECSKRNPEFYKAVQETLESKTMRIGRFVNKDRDGNEHDIDARIAPVFDKTGQVARYVVTVRDVSQEVQLQRQLRQIQKMEALGTLSEGIVHDFNNILDNIFRCSERGIIADAADETAQEDLFQILKETLHGKELIKSFKTMGQGKEQPQQQINISEVISSSTKSLAATIPSIIKLKKDITPGLGVIMGDPAHIHQVMTHLCTNAADAMQATGGILEISLTNMMIPVERICHYPNLSPGEHVKLTITDTGHGMDRDELERIFDPFYTTAQESGRGLGLSIVHGIIKNHGGEISVNSIVGVGTTFVILLPLIDPLEQQKALLRE